MNIWLIGYMGSGKSRLGTALSSNLGLRLLDTDQYIEKITKMSIADLWEKYGERYFRMLEGQVCQSLKVTHDTIIATGGGLPIHSFSIEKMRTSGHVVYLQAETSVLWARIQKNSKSRPLAMDEKKFKSRFEERKEVYGQADFVLDANQSAEQLINELKRQIHW